MRLTMVVEEKYGFGVDLARNARLPCAALKKKSMTLRAPADFRQMIFASLALLALGAPLFGQQAPVAHTLKMKGTPTPLSGLILSSDGKIVQFKTQAGS